MHIVFWCSYVTWYALEINSNIDTYILNLILVCTPLGFVRLFDVVGQFLIKPQFLRDIDEEYFACALEEECLRRRLKHVQHTGKSYVSPAPMSLDECTPVIRDEYDLSNSVLKLRNGELQTGLGSRLTEIETKRRLLGEFTELMQLKKWNILLCCISR